MSNLHDLAAAMRAGAKLRPQGFGAYLTVALANDGSVAIAASCALGAAYEGKAGPAKQVPTRDQVYQFFPDLWGKPCRCPVCHEGETILQMAIHLNDKHFWTREAIADWLDTL